MIRGGNKFFISQAIHIELCYCLEHGHHWVIVDDGQFLEMNEDLWLQIAGEAPTPPNPIGRYYETSNRQRRNKQPAASERLKQERLM
jgi:hypothetical protein